jgi:pyruvate dehydrogenase E2 component (dihydrolipoamide acetyltransferase)
MNAGELVVKKFYHIGYRVDTSGAGVVRSIGTRTSRFRDIAAEVVGLAEKARAASCQSARCAGRTFTIYQPRRHRRHGVHAHRNYPEVAILGLSRSALQPVVGTVRSCPR